MVELRGRWKVLIQFMSGPDQYRKRFNPGGIQHRLQQRMLVFAIAVLIVQDFRRHMWLISAYAERKAYVTDVPRDIFVDALGFFLVRLGARGEFADLFLNLWSGLDTVILKQAVPMLH